MMYVISEIKTRKTGESLKLVILIKEHRFPSQSSQKRLILSEKFGLYYKHRVCLE